MKKYRFYFLKGIKDGIKNNYMPPKPISLLDKIIYSFFYEIATKKYNDGFQIGIKRK